jgi:hypothetical protein
MRHARKAERRTKWKAVISVENNTYDVAAARDGAAFAGVCTLWASMPGMPMSHALTPNTAPVAFVPDARLAAFRQIPAMTKRTAALAAVPPTATDIRKHKTRVNAGGDGASGPHPEREPA